MAMLNNQTVFHFLFHGFLNLAVVEYSRTNPFLAVSEAYDCCWDPSSTIATYHDVSIRIHHLFLTPMPTVPNVFR